MMTLRVRVLVPAPPHDLVHFDHAADHAETAQSTGHLNVLHASMALLGTGHALPPNAAFWRTWRTRCRVPAPPHVSVHADHACHSEIMQSHGHGDLWHARVFVRPGHALPPWRAGVVAARVRVW